MRSILFVCLGNICRSSIADGVAKKITKDYGFNLHIDSAGTGHWHAGNPPCENSIKVAQNNGIDISNLKARKVEQKDKIDFDYVASMDENNYHELKKMGFENLYKIGNYGGFKGVCVPDPCCYPGFEGFDKIYEMLDTCIKDFLKTKRLLK